MNWIRAYFRRLALQAFIAEVRAKNRIRLVPTCEREGYGILSVSPWTYLLKKRDGFDHRWDLVERYAFIGSAIKELQRRTAVPT